MCSSFINVVRFYRSKPQILIIHFSKWRWQWSSRTGFKLPRLNERREEQWKRGVKQINKLLEKWSKTLPDSFWSALDPQHLRRRGEDCTERAKKEGLKGEGTWQAIIVTRGKNVPGNTYATVLMKYGTAGEHEKAVNEAMCLTWKMLPVYIPLG